MQAIDHVVIRSADPEATIAFYGDQLGLRLALDRTFEERGVRLIFFRVGGVTVEIAAQAGAELRAPMRRTSRGESPGRSTTSAPHTRGSATPAST